MQMRRFNPRWYFRAFLITQWSSCHCLWSSVESRISLLSFICHLFSQANDQLPSIHRCEISRLAWKRCRFILFSHRNQHSHIGLAREVQKSSQRKRNCFPPVRVVSFLEFIKSEEQTDKLVWQFAFLSNDLDTVWNSLELWPFIIYALSMCVCFPLGMKRQKAK